MIPKDLLDKIPALYANEDKKASETIVHCEIIMLGTNWAWYITEIDPKENLAFGWIKSGLGPDCSELGYINLNEIASLNRPLMISPVNFSLEYCRKTFI